jgi:hypothetical protein
MWINHRVVRFLVILCIGAGGIAWYITTHTPSSGGIGVASADFQYSASAQNIVTAGSTAGSFLNTKLSDNDYMRIVTADTGFDVRFTYSGVRLWNANTITVMYDGFATSSATLSYQIQMYDNQSGTWRNLIPHNGSYTNTAEAGVGLTLPTGTTGALSGGYVEVYNGYFSNGSGAAIDTPISNFIDGNGNLQLRLWSNTATTQLELFVDLLTIQVTNNPIYYASGLTVTTGGTPTNQYSDTTTDDNTTSLVIPHSSNTVDAYLSFSGASLPYSDANTFLIEFSGHVTTFTSYTVSLYDFTNTTWRQLNAGTLNNTSDATNYFAFVPSTLSLTMNDMIESGQMRLRINATGAAGSVTIDYARIIIGSTITGSGNSTLSLTRGTVTAGAASDTRSLDTTGGASVTLTSSNTDNSTTTNISNDCSAATNQCVAGTGFVPITLPANSVAQGTITAVRFLASNAALDMRFATRNTGPTTQTAGQQDIFFGDNVTAQTMFIREQSNPVRPLVGADGAAFTVPTYTPQRYIDTMNNTLGIRFYSAGSDTTSRTISVDFLFATVKSILPQNNAQYRFTPTAAVLTNGTNSSSNVNYTRADDGTNWTVTAGGSGVDGYVSFTGVTIPSGSNKLIITSNHGYSATATTHRMYLYDFVAVAWREISPHSALMTSDTTGGTVEYAQFQIFDGYFSSSNTPISTPLSNFVSSGEVRLRYLSTSASSNLLIDFVQIQFVIDPVYFASSVTTTTGTVANQYTDTYTDDNTTNFTVTPSGNVTDFYFSFTNVATPPEGMNAILYELSMFQTSASSFTIAQYNWRTAAWDTVKSSFTVTADATHYFLLQVGDWRDYISSGEMRVRINTTGNANAVNVDLVKLTLGTIPSSASTLSVTSGALTSGSVASLANLDTLSSTNELIPDNYLTVTAVNPQSGINAFDELSGRSLEVRFPFILPAGTNLAGITWMYRANTSSTSTTITPSLEEKPGVFRTLATTQLATLGAANALPNAYDTATLAVTTQTVRQGWFVDQLEDLWQAGGDRTVAMRLFTSASTVNSDARLFVDTMFFTYRYVPQPSTLTLSDRLRTGQWFFGGDRKPYSAN